MTEKKVTKQTFIGLVVMCSGIALLLLEPTNADFGAIAEGMTTSSPSVKLCIFHNLREVAKILI